MRSKKKKKHKPCSYMQIAPEGRRKPTIKLHQSLERRRANAAYNEQLCKWLDSFFGYKE